MVPSSSQAPPNPGRDETLLRSCGAKRVEKMSRRLTTSFVFVFFLLVCLITKPCSPAPPPRLPFDVDESSFDKVEFINFLPEEKQAVLKEFRRLVQPQCIMAYSRAGLRNPLEVITQEGMVLRPSVDLHKYSARQLGLVSETTRRVYWEDFSSCRAQAGTVSVKLYGVYLTTDGRARLFLHDTAFQGKSFIFRKLSLHDVLVHEFMHVGGQPPTPGWFFQHDLAGFDHYDEIMRACN
jgi:hypothetical protein